MRVFKWGESLAVPLPRPLILDLGLKAGDEIDVIFKGTREVATAKAHQRELFLKAMEQFRWPALKGYKFSRDDANEA